MTHPTTVDWADFAADCSDLAARVRTRFEATRHHVVATLRRDGSPRTSGTEVQFGEREMYVGMMHRSMKALDLLRDPRFALQSNPGDGTMAGGDARVSGVAREVPEGAELSRYVEAIQPPEPFHLFRLGISEVSMVSLHPDGDRLVIESWKPNRGLWRTERA